MKTIIFERKYDSEDVIDLSEHIENLMNRFPKDENGFINGSFNVIVEYIEEGDSDD